MTDASGHFDLLDLIPGHWTLMALASGLVGADATPTLPLGRGTSLTLSAGERRDRVVLSLSPGAVLAAQVVDEFGDPAPGQIVQMMHFEWDAGERRLAPLTEARWSDMTDDLGQVRLFGLPGGDYYPVALGGVFGTSLIEHLTEASARVPAFAPAYYPGTPLARDARPVRLVLGATTPATISLAPVLSGRVVGQVRLPESPPPAPELVTGLGLGDLPSLVGSAGSAMHSQIPDASIQLFPMQGNDVHAILPANARAARDGTFTFDGVPFGAYVLEARSPGFFVSQIVEISTEETSVSMALAPLGIASGTVDLDGAASISLTQVSIQFIPTDLISNPPRGSVHGRVGFDGAFDVHGITGTGILAATAKAPWLEERIVMHDGRDTTAEPVDFRAGAAGMHVILTDHTGSVSGQVRDETTKATEGTVIVFAADSSRWPLPAPLSYSSASTSNDGTFEIGPLLPGNYLAVALPTKAHVGQEDPRILLEELSSLGHAFTVSSRERVLVNLTISTRLDHLPWGIVRR